MQNSLSDGDNNDGVCYPICFDTSRDNDASLIRHAPIENYDGDGEDNHQPYSKSLSHGRLRVEWSRLQSSGLGV